MLIDIKNSLLRMPETERRKFVEMVISGFQKSVSSIEEFTRIMKRSEDNIVVMGAEFLSNTMGTMITVFKLYSDSFEDENVFKVYIYCIINLTILFMIRKELLSHKDMALIGLIFKLVDIEIVDQMLSTLKEETELRFHENDLKLEEEMLTRILAFLDSKSPELPN